MDRNVNPFSPGAGTPPPELAGRSEIIDQAITALMRVKNGRSEKSLLLVGLRGVGKTVLLNEIFRRADEQKYRTAFMEVPEARQGKSLRELLVPHLRTLLLNLDFGEKISAKVKQGLRVLKSFISGLKVKYEGISLDYDPAIGVADSGNLETDLADMFVALGEAAKDRGTAVAIIIDELQYLDEMDLSALIMAAHRISQRALPLVLIGAGLPQLVGKAGNAKSYAERLFTYPEVGALKEFDAKAALQLPVQEQGIEFTEEALDEIIRVTKCYPYFLQEWGYHAWNAAQQSPITYSDVQEATRRSITHLDNDFFKVRFDRLTPSERRYARAMAELGPVAQRSGDIAKLLGKPVNAVAPIRSQLIRKGMIYSSAHGDNAFTVPLFDEFMKRILPDMPSDIFEKSTVKKRSHKPKKK